MRYGAYLLRVRSTTSPLSPDDELAGAGLAERLGTPQVTFFGDPNAPFLVLPKGMGLIWGSLFDARGNRVRAVAPDTARAWTASGGRLLIANYWGHYIAVLVERGAVTVVRDPSGAVPCYYVSRPAGWLLASDAAQLRRGRAELREIDWNEIAAQLQYFSLRTARTALAGCTELLAGEALALRGRNLGTLPIWNPRDHLGDWRRPPAFEDAAGRLGQVVRTTVAALASAHRRVIAELSGGIDSSIVAAALAQAKADTYCLTFRGGGADLDEGRYARAVSDRWHLPLHAEPLALEHIDILRSAAAHLPRPSGRSFSQANDRQALAFARNHGADAFFVGTGGDNVLWYFNTAAPALDRLRFDGLFGFLATTRDIAAMCEVRFSAALRLALRKRRQPRPQPWPHDVRFLSRDLRNNLAPSHHSWLDGSGDDTPGVRAYMRALVQMQDHLDYHARSAVGPVVAPFLTQPVVEACLGIPSWLWCRHGTNRAVARAAFAQDLPPLVLTRRSKGSFDGFACELFERRRAELRAMLLDGRLAANDMLDRTAIEAAFASPPPLDSDVANRLLRLGAVEAWLEALPGRASS